MGEFEVNLANNVFKYWNTLMEFCSVKIFKNDNIQRYYSKSNPITFTNRITHFQYNDTQEFMSELDKIIQECKENKLPISVEIYPISRPKGIESQLIAKGFEKSPHFPPSMVFKTLERNWMISRNI